MSYLTHNEDIPTQPPLPLDDSPLILPLPPLPPPPPSAQTSNQSSEPLDFDNDVGGHNCQLLPVFNTKEHMGSEIDNCIKDVEVHDDLTESSQKKDRSTASLHVKSEHAEVTASFQSKSITTVSNNDDLSIEAAHRAISLLVSGSQHADRDNDGDMNHLTKDYVDSKSGNDTSDSAVSKKRATSPSTSDDEEDDGHPVSKRVRLSPHSITMVTGSSTPCPTYHHQSEALATSQHQAVGENQNLSSFSLKTETHSLLQSLNQTYSINTKDDFNKYSGEQEFDIIDAVESDIEENGMNDDEMYPGYGSEDDDSIDEDEIEAWLDEGMEPYHRRGQQAHSSDGDEEFSGPVEKEKVVLKERSHDPFEILPEGWVTVTHNSGMPIYLHKQTRVCTLSKPYFLGPGSARKHNIPTSAIPCLQYRRELEKECAKTSAPNMHNDQNSNTGVHIEDSSGANSDTSIPDSCPLVNGSCSKLNSDALSTPSESNNGMSVRIELAEERKRENNLDPLEVRTYCRKLFEFKTISVKRFKTWKDRRRHHQILKQQARPELPSTTKLITIPPMLAEKDEDKPAKKREFVLNPSGKSDVCILHEYVQHAMRVQPKYIFRECDNAQTPFSATIVINGVEYGTGYASSKKNAKNEAARITLGILIPEMNKMSDDVKSQDSQDLTFFDEVKIEDPRVYDLCNKVGQPSPFQILLECLKRNYGMGDTSYEMDMRTLKHQKSEFIMRVGKHEAKVICKNKREGKQQAAQAILQLLHPQLTSWGSLLRLYGRGSCKTMKEKKQMEQSITLLTVKAKEHKPNLAILTKLQEEMQKLREQRDSIKPKGKLLLDQSEIPVAGNVSSVDL